MKSSPLLAGQAPRPRLPLAQFGLAQLVACSTDLQNVALGATSLEAAAQSLATYLYGELRGPDGEPALALARVFATAQPDEVPEGGEGTSLVLLGTAGDLPAWNDRCSSVGHQVIPLGGGLDALPMVRGLFAQFGIDGPEPDVELAFTDFGVFHVQNARGNELIPSQEFVTEHGVESVLGFGCALADGRILAVLLFSRVTISDVTAQLFKTLAVSLQVALAPLAGAPVFAGMPGKGAVPTAVIEGAARRALEQLVVVLGEAVQTQSALLESEAAVVEELRALGAEVAAELDLERLVDAVVNAAVRTTGADIGAFFYNRIDEEGQSYVLYSIAGVDREHFAAFPMPGATQVFAPTFLGEGVVRSPDITRDGRYGHNSFGGMPSGHFPVRSYLAAPVVSRSGEVIGGLFLGHSCVDTFDYRAEALLVGLAGHAAVGIDNARLFATQRDTAVELQRSLLPGELSPLPGLEFRSHYRPGGSGSGVAVGGDWYDVIPLPQGRAAFVIGDVMGRGVRAAAAMGQLRTALRVLLSSGQPLDAALEFLDKLVSGLPSEQIATCAVGLYDPALGTVCLASAGHLPALIRYGQDLPGLVEVEPAGPLGALTSPPEVVEIPFPPGSMLVMFTDGLVENREESIDRGLQRLLDQVVAVDPRSDVDLLVSQMLEDGQDDDAAVLVVCAN